MSYSISFKVIVPKTSEGNTKIFGARIIFNQNLTLSSSIKIKLHPNISISAIIDCGI
uniref:Uncharacterized protein n=1 Tax=Helianthus annuus TaxID=4232 RepID=A0A251V799_HELAN